jgi:hypothetical protein
MFFAPKSVSNKDGYSGADMVSATLLKLLDPFNTSETWKTGRNDVQSGRWPTRCEG